MSKKTDDEEFGFFELTTSTLDKAFVEQPKLMFKYGRLAADAKRDFEQAKATIDLVWAEQDAKCRSNTAEYLGLDKPTEGAIKAWIQQRKIYQKAEKAALDAKHKMDVLNAAVVALEHRKRAIEGLIELLKLDYFSAPSVKPKGVRKDE